MRAGCQVLSELERIARVDLGRLPEGQHGGVPVLYVAWKLIVGTRAKNVYVAMIRKS